MTAAYLFPGQGSHFVGMGVELYQQEASARALFDEANERLGFSLSRLCFEGPEETLTDTINQQPALFVTSLAAWEVLKARGWPATTANGDANHMPESVAGHSLGEFSALAAAGSLSFVDGLALVRRRGELMKAAGEQQPGGMAAVLGLDAGEIAPLCREAADTTGQPVQVANDNCPGQVVISGHQIALEEAMKRIEAAGARKVVRLPITIAAHSVLMSPAAEAFGAAIDSTPIHPPAIPVIANVSARPLTTAAGIRAELKAQLTAPVAWTDSIRYLGQQGVDTFVEVGPGEVLLGLVKRINRQAQRIKFEL
jgi:[acyl-carrier-protein] S-malonyltransferase